MTGLQQALQNLHEHSQLTEHTKFNITTQNMRIIFYSEPPFQATYKQCVWILFQNISSQHRFQCTGFICSFLNVGQWRFCSTWQEDAVALHYFESVSPVLKVSKHSPNQQGEATESLN